MRFSVQKFNRHLNNLGQNYVWRRSYACSCVTPTSGAPDRKCQVCAGKGHFWLDGVACAAATASQKTQAKWEKSGMFEAGDIVVSIPENSPMWDCGQFDRIMMLNASDRFSMPLTRGATSERIIFTVEKLERVFWKHPQTQAIIEGGLPTISANGSLTWTSGEPPPGTSYSITGRKRSEYFVYMDFPRNRNMHYGFRLPKTTVLRRFDLFGR